MSTLFAQRAYEVSGEVIYEDARGVQTNLGAAFNPVLTHDGQVALLRGRKHSYGEDFDCTSRINKNWVTLYNPAIKTERVLFDRTIPFNNGTWKFCVFEDMQLSHDRSTLYLVSPVYATAGSLAIVHLATDRTTYVPGVNNVFVIQTGPHRDELIYQRRTLHKHDDGHEYPDYPFIHARADGSQVAEISVEDFTLGGNGDLPMLRKFLQELGGTITVNGQKLP